MKNEALMKMMPLALLVMAAITAGAPGEPQPSAQIVIRAEHGDTFGNLFGADWQKAFDQNRTTVIRKGKPVTSPDILLEGAILRVTGDVRLTPRAIARVDTLVKRRAALRQRLVDLVTKTSVPAALRAAELRRLLDNDFRYAGDMDFIEHEIAKLETVDPPALGPARSSPFWPIAGSAAAVIFLVWFALLRRRKDRPGGDERMKAVLNDLDQALHAPPLDR